jgi:hypothetical protein
MRKLFHKNNTNFAKFHTEIHKEFVKFREYLWVLFMYLLEIKSFTLNQ